MQRILQNPTEFARECKKKNVTLELLQEAVEVLTAHGTAQMFQGKSTRGVEKAISSAQLKVWINTLQHAKDHPDESGKPSKKGEYITPKEPEWSNFVKSVMTEIPIERMQSWENMSLNKLAIEAEDIGITHGLKNAKPKGELPQRLPELYKRRKTKFWDVQKLSLI